MLSCMLFYMFSAYRIFIPRREKGVAPSEKNFPRLCNALGIIGICCSIDISTTCPVHKRRCFMLFLLYWYCKCNRCDCRRARECECRHNHGHECECKCNCECRCGVCKRECECKKCNSCNVSVCRHTGPSCSLCNRGDRYGM